MTARDRSVPKGSVQRLVIDSKVLKRNLLGDPARREIAVYVPAEQSGAGLPLLLDLVATPRAVRRMSIGAPSARTCRSGSTG
jgi:hypothetical protein